MYRHVIYRPFALIYIMQWVRRGKVILNGLSSAYITECIHRVILFVYSLFSGYHQVTKLNEVWAVLKYM